MESQEGKNSNLSDASSAKYNVQVGPALWASCAKKQFFSPVLKQHGWKRVLQGNHGSLSFHSWLLIESLEWNEIRISVDLSSPLTRNRILFSRVLLLALPLSLYMCVYIHIYIHTCICIFYFFGERQFRMASDTCWDFGRVIS